MSEHSPAFVPVSIRRHAGGLQLGCTRYLPRAICALHCHQNARLVVVLRGVFAEGYGARSRQGTPYLAYYRPPGELHRESFGPEGATCISVDLPAGWLHRTGVAVPGGARERRGLDMVAAVDDLDRELSEWDDVAPLAAEALVLELLAELAGTADPRVPPWWHRAKERLHDGFREPLGLGELAAAAGVHPVHLARSFRTRAGRTVGAYLRELRVGWARAELLRSDESIAGIAAAAGFSDESHLCRTMKRLTGESPGAARRRRRARR